MLNRRHQLEAFAAELPDRLNQFVHSLTAVVRVHACERNKSVRI
jgi:hypothetical protein